MSSQRNSPWRILLVYKDLARCSGCLRKRNVVVFQHKFQFMYLEVLYFTAGLDHSGRCAGKTSFAQPRIKRTRNGRNENITEHERLGVGEAHTDVETAIANVVASSSADYVLAVHIRSSKYCPCAHASLLTFFFGSWRVSCRPIKCNPKW